jgi:6-phosphogluconolactonase/glucosamine-6-phosphate isomerase/deaminase
MVHATNCVRTFGDFHLAVQATTDLEPLFIRLMYDPATREFPWKRTHLWLVDESPGGERARVVREAVVEPSDIPIEQFHPMPTGPASAGAFEGGGGDSAEVAYERDLREQLGWREKGHDRLDFVLLSLDEGGPVVRTLPPADAGRLVQAMSGANVPGICLTVPFLNASRFLAVVAYGERLRSVVGTLAQTWRDLPRGARSKPDGIHPLGLRLRPVGGELRWYLDLAATCG